MGGLVAFERRRIAGPDLGRGEGAVLVDPLPQALILTSIVISFAVTAFLLTLLVATYRRVEHLGADELANDDRPKVLVEP